MDVSSAPVRPGNPFKELQTEYENGDKSIKIEVSRQRLALAATLRKELEVYESEKNKNSGSNIFFYFIEILKEATLDPVWGNMHSQSIGNAQFEEHFFQMTYWINTLTKLQDEITEKEKTITNHINHCISSFADENQRRLAGLLWQKYGGIVLDSISGIARTGARTR